MRAGHGGPRRAGAALAGARMPARRRRSLSLQDGPHRRRRRLSAQEGASGGEFLAQGPAPIEDYALIGDCTTAALVSRAGAIDWLCWPRFDSPSCFAALLGGPEHGTWRIAPEDPAPSVERRYTDGTMVLETRFTTGSGEVALIDFMPVGNHGSAVVRLVEGRRGRVDMRMGLALRFFYGSAVPWVTRLPDGSGLAAIAGPDMAVLRTPVEAAGRGVHHRGALHACTRGRRCRSCSATAPATSSRRSRWTPRAALTETQRFWSRWSRRCVAVAGRMPRRCSASLLTLKALTYHPTGGIVAAATTSPARAARRPAQLGLSLLLAARCDAHAARLHARGLFRGGAGLARLVASQHRRAAGPGADHVRPRRRAAPARVGGGLAARATRARGRCASATPPTTSSSSMSMAR